MCKISSVTKFSEKKSHFATVAVEPFFSGSALDWNLSCFSSFSVAGDNYKCEYVFLSIEPGRHLCRRSCGRIHQAIFAYSKQSKAGGGEGLCVCRSIRGVLEVDLQSHELGIIQMKQRKIK